MKRHHMRTAQNIFTLSLMSGLTLLAACGGGGGGGGAPAAPAAVDTTPVPTLLGISDPNEPYLVGESYKISQESQQYQLSVIDGITQEIKLAIPFNGPTSGKWFTVDQIVRTTDTSTGTTSTSSAASSSPSVTEVDKGPSTLYYVEPSAKILTSGSTPVVDPDTGLPLHTNPGGKIFQLDLKRTSDLTAKQISPVSNACSISFAYNLELDGSKSAMLVTTPGVDGECGEPTSTIKQERDQAKDNVVSYLVITDDSTAATNFHKPVNPATQKILTYLYNDAGSLTGILTQRNFVTTGSDGKTQNVAQLDVLSSTQDKVLTDYTEVSSDGKTSTTHSGVPITNGSSAPVSTYAYDPTNPALVGAQWITRAPGTYSNGYMRIQDSISNRFYKFTWDPTTPNPTSSLTLVNTRALKPGPASNVGITDDKYIYFVNGTDLVYGPTDTGRFPTRILGFTTTDDPVTELHQTAKTVIALQKQANGTTQLYGIDKQTGYSLPLVSGDQSKFEFLGIHGDDLYFTNIADSTNAGTNLFHVSTLLDPNNFNIPSQLQLGLIVQAKVMDNKLSYGDKNLSKLVACKPTGVRSTSCLNATLKVYDLNVNNYTYDLGPLTIDDSNSITSTPAAALAGNNNVFTVKKTLPDGVTNSQSPWIYQVGAPQTLKEIDAFSTTSSTTK